MTVLASARRKSFTRCVSLAAIVLLSGCGGSEMAIDLPLLTRYHEMGISKTPVSATDAIDCYLDYSAGMGEGMRATAETNDRLKNFLGGRRVTYYRVGAVDEPTPIDISSAAANFIDLKNYTDIGSKLKRPLDNIVSHKDRVSIFITDFERIEDVSLKQKLPGAPGAHPIDASAWAQKEFKEWLTAGNRIDIFATPYAKPDYRFDSKHMYPNWIYTLIFTPRAVLVNDSAYKSSVIAFMVEEYRQHGASTAKSFSYDANAFVVQHPTNPTSGNANDNLIVQDYFSGPVDKDFEYYEFNAKELVNFNVDQEQKDKRIIKVRVVSQVPFASDVVFGIKVYDVTEPLATLYNAATQAPPTINTDVETGKKDTIGNKPIAPTYTRGQEIDSMFDFVYNMESKELGIKLKPDYSGNVGTAVYKIDIVVASVTLRDFAAEDEVMKLNYGGGYTIRSLGESIRLAVRDVAAGMTGRVLYTLYVKIK